MSLGMQVSEPNCLPVLGSLGAVHFLIIQNSVLAASNLFFEIILQNDLLIYKPLIGITIDRTMVSIVAKVWRGTTKWWWGMATFDLPFSTVFGAIIHTFAPLSSLGDTNSWWGARPCFSSSTCSHPFTTLDWGWALGIDHTCQSKNNDEKLHDDDLQGDQVW